MKDDKDDPLKEMGEMLRTVPHISAKQANEMGECLQKIDKKFKAMTVHLVLNGEGGAVFTLQPEQISKSDLAAIYERMALELRNELFIEHFSLTTTTN